MDTIARVHAREILNAKGNPTVETEIETSSGKIVTASVPSGTSTGKYEAFVLLDGGIRYEGKGVQKAVDNVNTVIAERLIGRKLDNLKKIDELLIDLDGTENKTKLGANAILSVSVACAKAIAVAKREPLYATLASKKEFKLPDIIATVVSGGNFSPSGLDFEDYLYIMHGFDKFSEELEALVALRKNLEKNLVKKFGPILEDGGALAAPLTSTEEAFEFMLSTSKECGFEKNIGLGLDVAASELHQGNSIYKIKQGMNREQLVAYYNELIDKYPLTYLEDGFDEDDVEGFKLLSSSTSKIQNVGDDLFTSNIKRLRKYHTFANGLLLKINQIGTVSEAIEAADFAKKNNMDVIVSLRSGETTDDFIADLAVAIGAKQIKLGSPVRAERNVKYNRLLKIEEELEATK